MRHNLETVADRRSFQNNEKRPFCVNYLTSGVRELSNLNEKIQKTNKYLLRMTKIPVEIYNPMC